MQEILVFQQDRSADVRRFVVGFIEEAWQVLQFSFNYYFTGLLSLKSQQSVRLFPSQSRYKCSWNAVAYL